MTTLYTSNLIVVTENLVEILIDRVILDALTQLELFKYSSQDELLGEIYPSISYVENSVENKTRIRVFLNPGQVQSEEKIQIKLIQ